MSWLEKMLKDKLGIESSDTLDVKVGKLFINGSRLAEDGIKDNAVNFAKKLSDDQLLYKLEDPSVNDVGREIFMDEARRRRLI